jgi:16S rRNA processing protein RimM
VDGYVEAGRVGRPHGLDGSFHVTLPDADLLAAPLWLAGRRVEIERRAGTDARRILRVRGIATRDAIEALRGQPLLVAREDLPALDAEEFWAHDLVGCAVVDGDMAVGEVARMLGLPSVDVLEVVRPGGGEPLLVPLVRDAVRSVDPAARRVDVDLGFLGAD